MSNGTRSLRTVEGLPGPYTAAEGWPSLESEDAAPPPQLASIPKSTAAPHGSARHHEKAIFSNPMPKAHELMKKVNWSPRGGVRYRIHHPTACAKT
jgi:hypothetical protein